MLRAVAALTLGLLTAMAVGILAGFGIGALLLAAPFVLAYGLIRQHLPRRAPTLH